MTPPCKRIMLIPDRTFTKPRDIEIIVLGEPLAIAPFVADLRATIEHWEGFEAVDVIAMGEQMLGFRATRSKWATHDEPVAEAMRMLNSPLLAQYRVEIAWPEGVVGSW